MKSTVLAATAAAAIAIAAPTMAASTLTPGDTLDLQYQYPAPGQVEQDSGPLTYTGPGQSISTQFGLTTVILNNGQIAFEDDCPTCQEAPAAWNGPVLYDLSNGMAFDGWTMLQDTVGVTSATIGGGVLGVNWQGAPINGEVVFGLVPEPMTWAMMILGVAMVGLRVRRRARPAAAPA